MGNKNIPLEYQLFRLYKYRQMLCACSQKVQLSIVLESLVGRHRGGNEKNVHLWGLQLIAQSLTLCEDFEVLFSLDQSALSSQRLHCLCLLTAGI